MALHAMQMQRSEVFNRRVLSGALMLSAMANPISTRYRYRSLTAAIADKSCPVRQYLDDTFGCRTAIQSAYRDAVGELLVPGGEANAGTLGAACDFMFRMMLGPKHRPLVAFQAFSEPRNVEAIVRVAQLAGEAVETVSVLLEK